MIFIIHTGIIRCPVRTARTDHIRVCHEHERFFLVCLQFPHLLCHIVTEGATVSLSPVKDGTQNMVHTEIFFIDMPPLSCLCIL